MNSTFRLLALQGLLSGKSRHHTFEAAWVAALAWSGELIVVVMRARGMKR